MENCNEILWQKQFTLLRCTQSGATHRLDIFAERFDKTVFKYIRKIPRPDARRHLPGWNGILRIRSTAPHRRKNV
jgi:hypothetical protein